MRKCTGITHQNGFSQLYIRTRWSFCIYICWNIILAKLDDAIHLNQHLFLTKMIFLLAARVSSARQQNLCKLISSSAVPWWLSHVGIAHHSFLCGHTQEELIKDWLRNPHGQRGQARLEATNSQDLQYVRPKFQEDTPPKKQCKWTLSKKGLTNCIQLHINYCHSWKSLKISHLACWGIVHISRFRSVLLPGRKGKKARKFLATQWQNHRTSNSASVKMPFLDAKTLISADFVCFWWCQHLIVTLWLWLT